MIPLLTIFGITAFAALLAKKSSTAQARTAAAVTSPSSPELSSPAQPSVVRLLKDIQVSSLSSQNLAQLKANGVVILIIGNPNPDRSKGEVLTSVPTVEGYIPFSDLQRVAALAFVRRIVEPIYGMTG